MKKLAVSLLLVAFVFVTLTPIGGQPAPARAGVASCEEVRVEINTWVYQTQHVETWEYNFVGVWILWTQIGRYTTAELVAEDTEGNISTLDTITTTSDCAAMYQNIPTTAICTYDVTSSTTMTTKELYETYSETLYEFHYVLGLYPIIYITVDGYVVAIVETFYAEETVTVKTVTNVSCSWPDPTGCLGLRVKNPEQYVGQNLEFYWLDGSDQWSLIQNGGYPMGPYGDVDFMFTPGQSPQGTFQGQIGGVPVVKFETTANACLITNMSNELEVRPGSSPVFELNLQ